MTGNKGQSLVEVLIAILVVTLVLTAIVVAVLLAIKSSQLSRHQARATFLGQEAVEWLRSQRQELGWAELANYATFDGADYCLGDLGFTNPGDCVAGEEIEGMFNRQVELVLSAQNQQLEARVEVWWYEGDKRFSSRVTAKLAQWDYQN